MPTDVMQEILPGVWHWTALHAPIGASVSSYFVEPAGVVIDPKIPDGGIEAAFENREAPQQVVLTSGHHGRDSQAFADALGIPIRGSFQAAERLAGTLDVEPLDDGEEVVPGLVTYLHVGVLAPDEGALHIAVGEGALALADSVNTYGETLGFFPDDLLGDDPQAVKDGLRNRLRTFLERDFDAVLFAHGAPLASGGKAALKAFAT